VISGPGIAAGSNFAFPASNGTPKKPRGPLPPAVPGLRVGGSIYVADDTQRSHRKLPAVDTMPTILGLAGVSTPPSVSARWHHPAFREPLPVLAQYIAARASERQISHRPTHSPHTSCSLTHSDIYMKCMPDGRPLLRPSATHGERSHTRGAQRAPGRAAGCLPRRLGGGGGGGGGSTVAHGAAD
jgi:hypothetical protein